MRQELIRETTGAAYSGSRDRHLDPDHDGVSNFLEYAHGSDPLDGDSAELPEMRILDSEVGRSPTKFVRIHVDRKVVDFLSFLAINTNNE